jgi:hypothetical protein
MTVMVVSVNQDFEDVNYGFPTFKDRRFGLQHDEVKGHLKALVDHYKATGKDFDLSVELDTVWTSPDGVETEKLDYRFNTEDETFELKHKIVSKTELLRESWGFKLW